MPVQIPESHRDLLEKPIVVTLASVMPNGKPHQTPVWRRFDGNYVYVTVETKSQKYKNMKYSPAASVVAIDPNNSGRWLEIRGTVEIIETDAMAEVDRQTMLYLGKEHYYGEVEPAENGEKYVGAILKITPTKVTTSG